MVKGVKQATCLYEDGNLDVGLTGPIVQSQEEASFETSKVVSKNPVGDESVDLRGFPSDRSKTGTWKAALFFFVLNFGETVAYLSVAFNMVTYLVVDLRQDNQLATTTFSNFMGTSYILPILGAFVADSYLGGYWTLLCGAVIYVLGLLLLNLSVSLSYFKPPSCSTPCEPAHGRVMAVFHAAIYLIAVGAGGVKPGIQTLGGDQFDESVPEEKRKRPNFFSLLAWALQIGSLLALSAIVYIQDNVGRTWGFGISSITFLACLIIFVAGTPFFRHKKPAGSAVTRIFQVVSSAIRKYWAAYPADSKVLYDISEKDAAALKGRKLSHTEEFRFLDRAAIVTDGDLLPDGRASSPWKLCPVTQVEETKRLLHVLPIWLTTIIPYCCFAQIFSWTVVQCMTMDRHVGASSFQIPFSTYSIFTFIFATIALPLYDPYFMPMLRKFTGHPKGMSTLTRMGVGLAISVLAMITAAVVENKRKRVATRDGLLDNPLMEIRITAFWLVPQIVLLGMTEVLLTVGQMNFFYKEMPDGMRTMGSGLFLSTIAFGYFIASFLVTTVNRYTKSGSYGGWLGPNINRGDLQNFYWMLAALSAANLGFFVLAAYLYKYKRVAKHLGSHRHFGVVVDSSEQRASVDSTFSPARPSDAYLLQHISKSSRGW